MDVNRAIRALDRLERITAAIKGVPFTKSVMQLPAPGVLEELEPGEPMDTAKSIEIRKEIRRWHTKALKSFKAGKGADVPFESEILPAEYIERVRAAMVSVADEDAIANAFSKAADTIPLVLVITEDDIARALESWDALMPEEFKGMLAAKPVGKAKKEAQAEAENG